MPTFDNDAVVRQHFPDRLRAAGITVETRDIDENEALPALIGRLIRMANILNNDPHTDTAKKLAEVTTTLAEVQLLTGVSDSELAEESARLAAADGSLRPHTYITKTEVPDGSEWLENPFYQDLTPHERHWV